MINTFTLTYIGLRDYNNEQLFIQTLRFRLLFEDCFFYDKAVPALDYFLLCNCIYKRAQKIDGRMTMHSLHNLKLQH